MSNEIKLDSEWDGCLIGYEGHQWVYCLSLMIKKLIGDYPTMTEEDALEYIDYNIIGFHPHGITFIDDHNYEFSLMVFRGEDNATA